MNDTAAVAARCIADPAFARSLVEGDDHPEVRAAVVADAIEGAEVSGFFNPQPDPPGKVGDLLVFDRVSEMWGQIKLAQLNGLAGPAA